jgi:hypothetical protein
MNWTRGLLTGVIAGPAGALGAALFSRSDPIGLAVMAVAIGVGSGIGVAWVSRTVSADSPATVDAAVAAAAASWQLKNLKASAPDSSGAVTLSRGKGAFGDSVTIAPSGTGVRLTGPAAVIGILKKKLG